MGDMFTPSEFDIEVDGNNSGQGKVENLPAGIRGWSWGACVLSVIWAIGNRTWIGLLALIPYFGFLVVLVLGFKGREWAWQNKRWNSVAHFQRVQKRWSFWGALILVLLVGAVIMVVIGVPIYQGYLIR